MAVAEHERRGRAKGIAPLHRLSAFPPGPSTRLLILLHERNLIVYSQSLLVARSA